jgi:nondiscriminating glutamyl-tRNA synthetase
MVNFSAMPENIAANVRVRFAPSPTGFIHVGNVRTALFNWLVARRQNGSFIVRIEDTDAERSRLVYEEKLLADLRWLGLEWDEGVDRGGPYGPYRQTDRFEIYRNYAESLTTSGKAFYCFCSEEELERVRQQQIALGQTPIYSGACRSLPADRVQARRRPGEPAALRLRVRPGKVNFSDLVYGEIEVETHQISDPVVLRSDGSPTYNFSCVVDDILMKISHVIRGEGHLSNTPRQILIYEALGEPTPKFAHLSTVLGPDGQKLSKRHGATSLEEFRAQGYLPQALANYLALLGWSPPEEGKEILPLDEIVRNFDLMRVSKSPAIFDRTKLDWVNRSYISSEASETLAELAEPYFVQTGLIPPQPDSSIRSWLAGVVDLIKTRVDRLEQFPEKSAIIFEAPPLDEDARATLAQPAALAVAREFARLVEERETLTPEAYKEIVGQVKASTGQKGKNLFHPIRAVLTGCASGPELERLIPLYEQGSRLSLLHKVLSCRERIHTVLNSLA